MQGLLSGLPGKDERILDAERDGLALLRAESRLEVDLHPLIAQRVRAQFLLGEYEMAAMVGLREVEIRVHQLTGEAPGALAFR